MKQALTFIALICFVAQLALAQQDSDSFVEIQGYQYASASSGTLSSPTISIIQPGGQFEKINDDAFVFQLPPGETLGCRFALPVKAYNVEAIVAYKVANGDAKGLVRWNGILFPEEHAVLNKGKDDDLIQKKIPLKDFRQNNLLEILAFDGSLQIRSVKILYNYRMPSCTVGDVTVTLLSPDPDLDGLTSDIKLTWKGTGPCEKGWITIKYKDGEEWKTVPGAEAFDRQDEAWKDKFCGQFVWKNHSLNSFPDLKIEYNEGKNPKRQKADQFAAEAQKLFLEQKYDKANRQIDAALALYPNNEFYKQILMTVVEKIFSPEECNAGDRAVVIINGVEFAFRWCPAGTFTMGSLTSEDGRYDDETQHRVTLTKGFWMLETEVTQKQWKAVMGNNPSYFKGDDLPVECVSWKDCQEFCEKCTKLGLPVQLPSEAQWEYACRAGSTGAYAGNLDEMAWHSSNSGNKTHPVGTKKANAWGLYDMHGNVWEWYQDWYAKEYPSGSVTDPTGPSSGSLRVGRGGSWVSNAGQCRSVDGYVNEPDNRSGNLGFRCVKGQ